MPQANSQLILDAQRGWRTELVERTAWATEEIDLQVLAGQMLLYLDEPRACLAMASRMLRKQLGADRVDAGIISTDAVTYSPMVEDRCLMNMPSASGYVFDLQDDGTYTFSQVPQMLLKGDRPDHFKV